MNQAIKPEVTGNTTSTVNAEEPIIIAIDHGYGNIKTSNFCFPANVTPIQKTKRQFEEWRTRSIDLLNSYYAILDEQERACMRLGSEAPDRNALDRITEKKAVIHFYLNTLQSGTLDDQIDLYLYGREVITQIEWRLEEHQQREAGQAVGGDGDGGLRPGAAASERERQGHADH